MNLNLNFIPLLPQFLGLSSQIYCKRQEHQIRFNNYIYCDVKYFRLSFHNNVLLFKIYCWIIIIVEFWLPISRYIKVHFPTTKCTIILVHNKFNHNFVDYNSNNYNKTNIVLIMIIKINKINFFNANKRDV